MGSAAHRSRHAVRRAEVHSATELTRTSHLELAEARRRRDSLLAAARSLRAAADRSCPNGCSRTCRLHHGADAQLTELAARLAQLDDGPASVCEPSVALASFATALAEAIEAVRACRQTLHPVGECWFSTEPGDDGCGEILRLAHRLSN